MDWRTRLKQYRKRNGLTQQALADHFGVERTTIIRWELGQVEPSHGYRKRILALAPTVPEGVVRSLTSFIDSLDGFATLLDSEFRVVRTTRTHQRLMGYDGAEVYGRPSKKYWSAQMERIMKAVGGERGYKRLGVHTMDLALVREPGENGFGNVRPILSIGRTVAVGDPLDPICHLTTLHNVGEYHGGELPAPVVSGHDGPLQLSI